MITTMVLISLLGAGFLFAYRAGKRMNRLDQMENAQELVREVKEDEKEIDRQTEEHISRANPIGSPWLRKRRR